MLHSVPIPTLPLSMEESVPGNDFANRFCLWGRMVFLWLGDPSEEWSPVRRPPFWYSWTSRFEVQLLERLLFTLQETL